MFDFVQIYFYGDKDRFIPRKFMEVMYFIFIGIRAIINWINFYE